MIRWCCGSVGIEIVGMPPWYRSLIETMEEYMAKNVPDLNNKTPQWFKDFFYRQFLPEKHARSRNTKLIYIILAVILAASLAGNGSLDVVGRLLGGIGG